MFYLSAHRRLTICLVLRMKDENTKLLFYPKPLHILSWTLYHPRKEQDYGMIALIITLVSLFRMVPYSVAWFRS